MERLISGTRYDLVHDSCKKVSQGARFFTVVLACTKRLNKVYRKIVYKNFQFFQPLISNSFTFICELVVFIDINTYILTEGTNFKTLLKENYAIALDSYYLFTKKMLNMELNLILIILMELPTIRQS